MGGMWGKKVDRPWENKDKAETRPVPRVQIGKGSATSFLNSLKQAQGIAVEPPKPAPVSVVWTPPISPKEQRRRLLHRAKLLHDRIIRRGELEAEIFIQNGIDLFNFKRHGLWSWINGRGPDKEVTVYQSFDAYVADPDNHVTDSTAHLGVQVVTLFLYLLRFKWQAMMSIGQKKLAILTPYLQSKLLDRLYVIRNEDGEFVEYNLIDIDPVKWKRYRGIAEYWVAKAQTLSFTTLADELGRQKGWDTLYHTPISVGTLRSFKTVTDLLNHFGLSGLPDDEMVYPNWRRKLQHRKAEK